MLELGARLTVAGVTFEHPLLVADCTTGAYLAERGTVPLNRKAVWWEPAAAP